MKELPPLEKLDDVEWIYLNLSSKKGKYTQPPPNGGAEAMLHIIQQKDSLMTEFARQLFKKMENERKLKDGFADDGREVLAKLDALVLAFKQRENK